MTDKLIPSVKYQFSEPFRTRFEQVMKGIGLPDRSKYVPRREVKPPTEAQMRLLARLGYNGPKPESLWDCSKLIDGLMKK